MKVIYILFLSCFSMSQIQAQVAHKKDMSDSAFNGKSFFDSHNEFYIYGGAQVIGNNIVSVNDLVDYNETQQNNDALNIVYIDIDKEKHTFSSSAATLKLPKNLKKITYAGLYWTATYSLEKGKRKETKNGYEYKGSFRKKKDIQNIKFKTPDGSYVDVAGKIIYDGAKNQTQKYNSPYVCYADITTLLKQAKVLNGDYTVANIKASRGYISGGSAAGWMLYIVYQAPTEYPKYISTFNGFASVGDSPVDITFKNFKSVDQGEVKTRLTISALETDACSKQDECAIIKKDGTFKTLNNQSINQQNFFNSSITRNGVVNTARYPASINTLGFNITELDIPNKDNDIIDNNTNETTLSLNSGSDSYYVYFTAFETEIIQNFTEETVEENLPVKNNVVVEKATVIAPIINIEKPKRKYTWKPPGKQSFNSKAYRYLLKQKATSFNTIDRGYYVVTNVFSEPEKAQKWESYLLKKGYTPKTVINPKNNWEYVSVLQTEDPEEAFVLQQELRQIYRFKDTWILKLKLE